MKKLYIDFDGVILDTIPIIYKRLEKENIDVTEEKALIVATNGFVKKSQKTPNKEIKRAEKIRQEYLNSK